MRKSWLAALTIIVFLSLGCAAQIADNATPMVVAVANAPKVETAQVETPRPVHRFFDGENLSLTAMTFSAALADGITTQHALAQHRSSTTVVNGVSTNYAVTYVERNPIAAPLVNRGWPGQIAATALTAGADLGIRNWLHRTGHHRMERVVPFLFAATSASFAAHNTRYW